MPETAPIRFAPSTTGHAHPGTLLSALLCWLDARSRGAPFIIRLENIDPERTSPDYETAMLDDLAWFGLDWDDVINQREQTPHHEAALDQLAAKNLLYVCSCTRSRIKSKSRPAPDGGFAYDNCCRDQRVTPDDWRACTLPLRVCLPDHEVRLNDESGIAHTQTPARDMGDPVVRRRDGAIAYHLACVVDDYRAGIRRLIRGRDLLPSAPVQLLLQNILGYPEPAYRHHFLLLEHHGGKLAKFHGAVGATELRKHYAPEALCGLIASWAGLIQQSRPCRPTELLTNFSWENIRRDDLAVMWDGSRLREFTKSN